MTYARKYNVTAIFLLGLCIQSCLATAALPAGGRRALSAAKASAPSATKVSAPPAAKASAPSTAKASAPSAASADAPSSVGAATSSGDGGKVFDIRNHGAKADGTTNNFKAFLNAWIAVCGSTEPAKLLVPQGKFMVGSVVFAGPCKSKVTVEVQGTIVATSALSDYKTSEWFLFEKIDNLVVTGSGTFDGNGAESWKRNERGGGDHQSALPPCSLKFRNLNNVVIQNIKSINAKAFHMFIAGSTNVKVNGVTITAPEDSPNTDGIHTSTSNLVNITDSVIGTGDDCVSIGQGTTSISVERVVCGPGHGISIGSLGKYDTEKDVSGVFVNNCTLKGTDNGVRIKTWKSSPPSQATNITFQDIIMENVKNPIIIDQNYGNNKNGPSQVKIVDVLFKNIRGTSVSDNVVSLNCSTATPCQGVKLADINLSGANGGGGSLCSNVKAIFEGKLSFPTCK